MARVDADGDSLYRRTHSPNLLAWSEGWRPFISSNKPGKLSKCLYHDHSTTTLPWYYYYGRPAQQMRTLYFHPVVSSFLWPAYGIGQTIIFLPCGLFYLSRRITLNHPSTAAMRLTANYFDHLLSLDTPTYSRTDSQAIRAEYCIVGIPHNTAIQLKLLLLLKCCLSNGRMITLCLENVKGRTLLCI